MIISKINCIMISALLCCFFIFKIAVAQETQKDAGSETTVSSNSGSNSNLSTAQKCIKEEDYKTEVVKEVERKMIKLGRESIVDFSKELIKKEDALNVREFELKKREQELGINEKSFAKRISDFRVEQGKYLSCLEDIDRQKESRISHMVATISNMKPDKASEILSVQDSDIAVQILGRLDPQKVSKIFNLMDKEISARLQKQYMTMKK